jgi:hypothetical protein
VLGLLVDLEPAQSKLLERICGGPTISTEQLSVAGVLTVTTKSKATKSEIQGQGLFDTENLADYLPAG